MHNLDISQTTSYQSISLLGMETTILHEITLGVHHLCILSAQSIIVRCEQDEMEEAAQEFHLDAIETYRLMMCLREVFQQIPMSSEEAQLHPIDTVRKQFYNR